MALVVGTTGNDDINAAFAPPTTPNADQVFGLEGDDSIASLGGDDTVDPGTGNDTVDAGEGDDTIIGGQGDDLLFGGSGDNTLSYEGSALAVTLFTQGRIEKEFTNSSLTSASAGTDQLVPATGFGAFTGPFTTADLVPSIQTIVGDSTQVNTISGVGSSNGAFDINLLLPTGDNFTVNIVSGSLAPASQSFRVENFSNVIGTVNNDVIIGSLGDNVISGSEGFDELDGSVGNDTLDYSDLAADINIGNFQTITIANPDALTVGLIPTITVDTALAFKDFGMVTEADGFSNFETIVGSDSGTNTIDGTLDEQLSN